MKRSHTLFVLPLLVAVCAGCATDTRPRFHSALKSGPYPWTGLAFRNDPKNFQFVIVTDRTGGHRPGVFEDAVAKVNLMQPEFVICVGDLIEGYTEDVAALDAQWREFDGIIDKLQAPFFYVPGNHDITNEVMDGVWRKRFGPPYHYFVYGDVLFLVLNTEDPPLAQVKLLPRFSDAQLDYVAKALEKHKNVRWTLVFMHQPAWNANPVDPNWLKLEEMLQDRPYTVYAGHHHRYYTYEHNRRNYYALATTGGGSRLRGPEFGEFDHFMWVTMTDNGPVMANIFLSGVMGAEGAPRTGVTTFDEVSAALKESYLPVGGAGKTVRRANTSLTLTNESKVAVDVLVKFMQHPDFRITPGAFDLHIEPGLGMDVPLEITAARAVPASSAPAVEAQVQYHFALPGKEGTYTLTRSVVIKLGED